MLTQFAGNSQISADIMTEAIEWRGRLTSAEFETMEELIPDGLPIILIRKCQARCK